jgi:thiamine-monophosphate kinase
VLPGTRGRQLLFTCDPVVEGVHYRPGTPARQVGWKAMARNLSDIAAMGGQPRWAVVSLGLRPRTPVAWVEQLYAGLHAAARRFGCAIVGGDTTHVTKEPFVVVTLLGEVKRARVALRSGARVGDAVFVTGTLGGSLAGKHLRFIPRLREAQWLVQHFRIQAMMDLSDGLASDLHRLAEASGVGFHIAGARVPCHGSLWEALTDGEDYELLFTVRRHDAQALRKAWPFRLRLTEIGGVIRGREVLCDGVGGNPKGYDHFALR